MHFPHEREERKLLLSVLVDEAQLNFKYLVTVLLTTGFFLCGAAVVSSTTLHTANKFALWKWLLYWDITILFLLLCLFLLPLIQSKRESKKLLGIKRGFILKTISPYLLTSVIFGNTLAVSVPDKLYLSSLVWSCGIAFSLFSISHFHLPVIRNLALFIIGLSLSIAIVLYRYDDINILQHQLANIVLLTSAAIPLTVFSLFYKLIKK